MKKDILAAHIIIIFTICLLFPSSLHAKRNIKEEVISYHAEIDISPDMSIVVTETITVTCARNFINRGIFRDFPKEYTDIKGNKHTFDFSILAVFKGDIPEKYTIKDLGKGTRLYIGKKDYILSLGEHKYTIIYEVKNPAVILKDSYEFYWDVTGIRWPIPINNASATIKLPYGNHERILTQEAYVGDEIASEEDVLIYMDISGNPFFTTKRPLQIKERFSVLVSWLKQPPPQKDKKRRAEKHKKHLSSLVIKQPKPLQKLLSTAPNVLRIGPFADLKGVEEIPLNNTIDLDFKTRDEIFTIRHEHVNRHSYLLDKKYMAFSPVFRSVSGGQPWWGLKGAFCYGPGEASFKGNSEATRFISNPFLLLGVDDSLPAHRKKRSFSPVYIKPVSLFWDVENAQAMVIYDMSLFLKEWKQLPYDLRNIPFTLINLNARDFGYRYVYASEEKSNGIIPAENSNLLEKASKLRNLIMPTYNCGYLKGCNAIAPQQPELYFHVTKSLPATLHCKLWKKKPHNVEQKADFIFIIHFE
jgi:hypothetical protein